MFQIDIDHHHGIRQHRINWKFFGEFTAPAAKRESSKRGVEVREDLKDG